MLTLAEASWVMGICVIWLVNCLSIPCLVHKNCKWPKEGILSLFIYRAGSKYLNTVGFASHAVSVTAI